MARLDHRCRRHLRTEVRSHLQAVPDREEPRRRRRGWPHHLAYHPRRPHYLRGPPVQYAILDSLEKALASAHIREQILRFVRLFALTFLGQLAVLQSQDHISRSFIV